MMQNYKKIDFNNKYKNTLNNINQMLIYWIIIKFTKNNKVKI